jgi:hypothetical protein
VGSTVAVEMEKKVVAESGCSGGTRQRGRHAGQQISVNGTIARFSFSNPC